jgi:NAD dependent epimerase/dehydratase
LRLQTDLPQFWHQKRVLVTGAGGFIGSHLVEALVRDGALVKAFVRYNSRADPGLLSILPADTLENIEIIQGDLCDLSAVKAAARGMEIIIHLGALIAIPYSYLHPAEVVKTNVIGTLNVLLAARENGIERMVHTSSSEVYGTAIETPINERHPLQGQSPYSASKIGADKLAESFYCSYNTPVVTIRPFNTYGPRQSARAIIPTIITQVLTQDVVYLGNLETQRDLTFVSDTVEGILCAAKTPNVEGETINLGYGRDIQVGELAQEIIGLIDKPVEIRVDPKRLRPNKSEVMRLVSDNHLAKERIGWSPSINLREGLGITIKWISEHIELYRPEQYSI